MIRFASAPGGRRTARNGADGRREWHQDHRAPPRRSLMGEGCRQAERERGVDRGTKAGRGSRMTQLRGRTPGPRARAPSDGRKSPGPPPRRRLRPAGHGAAAPRHRGAGRCQHASAHRAGYRDAVSLTCRGGQVGRRSGRRVYASRRFPRGWAEWSAWVNGARDPARRHRDRGHTRPPSQPSRAPSLPTCSRRQGRPAPVRGTRTRTGASGRARAPPRSTRRVNVSRVPPRNGAR